MYWVSGSTLYDHVSFHLVIVRLFSSTQGDGETNYTVECGTKTEDCDLGLWVSKSMVTVLVLVSVLFSESWSRKSAADLGVVFPVFSFELEVSSLHFNSHTNARYSKLTGRTEPLKILLTKYQFRVVCQFRLMSISVSIRVPSSSSWSWSPVLRSCSSDFSLVYITGRDERIVTIMSNTQPARHGPCNQHRSPMYFSTDPLPPVQRM